MIQAIGDGVTAMIGYAGDVVSALTATDGALAPLLVVFGLGIGASAVLFGTKILRSFTWGA